MTEHVEDRGLGGKKYIVQKYIMTMEGAVCGSCQLWLLVLSELELPVLLPNLV